MKKGLYLLLTAALASGMAAGCSGNSGNGKEEGATAGTTAVPSAGANLQLTGYPIVKEPITLKLMGSKDAIDGPWDSLILFKEMEKLTNIKIEFDTPPKENYEEKKNLAFASAQLPDFFFKGKLKDKDILNYGSQGLLIPLEGLIDKYAPNLKKLLESYPDVRRAITAPDGHIYTLPQGTATNRDHSLYGPRLWPNMQLLKELGIAKLPENTDQLYTLLKTVKEKKPDSVPLSAANLANLRWPILAAFGHILNYDAVTVGIEVRNDKVGFVPAMDDYKQYLLYMNKLYKEKLLDNDMFSHTSQEFTAKGNDNRIAIFPDYAPNGVLKLTREDILEQKYPVLPVLTSPVNKTQVYPMSPLITDKGNFAITKTNKHPEATIRWVDYFYSMQGTALMDFGVVLEQSKLDDPNFVFKAGSNLPEGAPADYYRKNLTIQQGPRFITKEYRDKIQQSEIWTYLTDITVEKYGAYGKEPFPVITLTQEDQQRVSVLSADIRKYVEQMEAKFIAGVESFDNWDKYVNTLKMMNIDELVKIHQTAYDRWNASK
ncbi:MAG: transporter substrate-binding protein [Paenibacillaceae bacterium]|jgi:putative aldouronate transport system substrate-binding protein|nr:transporter substrate-binding protein [Paenibacillaceae bacterium]